MQSRYGRLDRFLSKKLSIRRRQVKPLLAQQRIFVDGKAANDVQQQIGPFSHVVNDNQVLQEHEPLYIMLNKPKGVVSATKDKHHKTVLDLLSKPPAVALHIAGRLDYNSTGLILLTNDGRWSRRLSSPGSRVSKRYVVTLENPITDETVQAFSEGIYFKYESATTLPAGLTRICDRIAEVTLIEGRYHQIKRMFGHFNNPVLELHRQSIGGLSLCSNLKAGENRALTKEEAENVFISTA